MINRRRFVLGTALVGGGLVVGYRAVRYRARLPDKLPDSIPLEPGQTALTPYVVIDDRGITIITPRAEMGQGIHTTLAALVAEELDVDLDVVRVAHGPASEHYSNQFMFGQPPYPGRVHGFPTQSTIAQSSIRDGFEKMRKAGAAARSLLLRAAAELLNSDLTELTTQAGAVLTADGQRLPYETLARRAASFDVPTDPPIKPRSAWQLLGRSLPRVDMIAKCTGTAEYAMDVQLPDMLFATVIRNPHIDSPVVSMDASVAEKMPGVEHIVPIRDGAIVIASNTWYAMQAAQRIQFDWSPPEYPPDIESHRAEIRQAFEREPYLQAIEKGQVETEYAAEGTAISGAYTAPYLSHATMEPMNATARYRGDRLDIWVGNQAPMQAKLVGSRVSGLRPEQVHVHTTYMGGGFGRRFELYEAKEAVIAAMAVEGRPVRLIYTREEDLSHDAYRPMAGARYDAVIAEGTPITLDLKLSSSSVQGSGRRRESILLDTRNKGTPVADPAVTMGATDQPYKIRNHRVTVYLAHRPLPVGWWRSVGESQNAFFVESIMDELAHAGGEDPLDMRLAILDHKPSRDVLKTVAQMSGWGSPLAPGHGRGLAYCLSSDAATAQVIEVRVADEMVKLINVFAAVDVGIALDPKIIESQIEGSLIFGLSAAVFGEVTVAQGRVQQRNFDTYQILKLHQTPKIKVAILESGGEIFGAGECATATAAPALGNAIFAATGRRIRDLPFGRHLNFG